MKSLTKVKIINWHYFWNETVEMKPIVFLTGLNASGKSTFIDALEIVLLGDTSGRNFNKAASEKSNRTLKGYLRGEIGDTEDGSFQYLRNGRFSSYVACEFYDDLNDVYFTLGCVFDVYADGSEEHKFFKLDDKFPENEFIKDGVPMSQKDLNEFFKENYPNKFNFYDTNISYKEDLKIAFGGLKNKYFSLLKKATSFQPITDITTFITEYVVDSNVNIKVEEMQNYILQYKTLENEANNMLERIQDLEDICNVYKKYEDSKTDLTLCNYLIDRAEHQISVDTLNSYQTNLEKLKRRFLEVENELAEIEINKAELNKKRIKLITDKANDNTYQLTEELYEEKHELEQKINALEEIRDRVFQNLNDYAKWYIDASDAIIETFERINLDDLDSYVRNDIDDISESLKVVKSKSQELLNLLKDGINSITVDFLSSWKESIQVFKNLISAFALSTSKTLMNLNQRLKRLKEQQVNLQSGIKSYNPELNAIKNELKRQLETKYQREIEVAFFADLIDIRDKKWINACEGFMHNQKFYIFVEPRYYREAYGILKELTAKHRFYETALVDQEKIISRGYTADEDSLAEEIITDHEGARAYANFLIGRLIKCDTPEEARASGNGITAECDLYRNFVMSRMNPRLYEKSFISRKVGSRQLQEMKEDVVFTEKLIGNYRDLSVTISKANSLEVINKNEINNIVDDINSAYGISGLKQNLTYVEEELAKHDTNLIDSLDRRIAAIEEDLRNIGQEEKDLLVEKGNISSTINTLKSDKIKSEEANIKEKVKKLETYDKDFVKKVGSIKFEEELAEKKPIEIKTSNTLILNRAQYVSGNFFSQVKSQRRTYVERYHLSWPIDEESNDIYQNELIEVRDVKLPQYREKIADAYEKATKQFKNEFINKLRGQIKDVEDQIEDLNNALSSTEFGDDKYKFIVKPNPVYKRYYDMFKDDLLLQETESDNAFLEKYNDVMQDLFQQIISDDVNSRKDASVTAGIDKFTDYRSYLDFDLLVINKDGIEQRLSKMITKKSGGETQTPFYISVLASFAQLYRVNEKGEYGNTIRLIVFDEAFSKMDKDRIQKSIRLLRKFNLQTIVSAPSDKVGDISPEVDETLVVLRSNQVSNIRLYSKEK